VIDGLEADVVTLALGADIDAIAKAGLVAPNWKDKLPSRSVPYYSTIVLLVRKGNPKGIRDWGDLLKGDIQIITPNPKTSGGARWNYLAAWGWALRQPGGTEQSARAFVQALYARVPVLDSGARGSTTTFLERGIGDVLIAWENEALLASRKLAGDRVELVIPSSSIRTEPVVAVVDSVAQRHGTTAQARQYLEFLYQPQAQALIASHFLRPNDASVLSNQSVQFPSIPLFSIDDVFGGWEKAHATHFADGAVFDQISVKR
jgi:sulfate/thiosulfate-binding protein